MVRGRSLSRLLFTTPPVSRSRRRAGGVRELRRPRYRGADVADMARGVSQLRRHLPTTRAHDEHRPLALRGHHPDRHHQVGVVRDDHRRLESVVPGIVQHMGGQIHVRALLFHGMELGDHGVGDRDCGCAPGAFAATAPLRMGSVRQRPGARAEHPMVALGQRDRPGRLDPPARDRKVRESAPRRLGEKTPVMDLDLGQRRERVQIHPRAGRRPRIDLAGTTTTRTSTRPAPYGVGDWRSCTARSVSHLSELP